jgi:hypothetical protein
LSSIGCNAPSGGTTCNVPTSLSSSAVGSTTATVSWAAAIGATSYSLQYKTAAATTWTTVTSTSTSRALTGLTASTTYNYQVASVCASGTSAFSTAGSFTTTAVVTCTDAYEPNESRTGAKTIPLASNVSARISSATDKDYLKFVNTTAARNVRVTLSNLPADYDLKLYRSSTLVGTSQNSGTSNESLIYNNTQAATTYTAYVYGYNGAFNATSCYTIRAEISGTSFVRQSAEELEIMNEELSNEPLQVYPNPTSGLLNIRLQPEGDINQTVEVYNQLGQKVESFELSFTKEMPAVELQLSDLTDGIYFVRVYDGNTVQTRKVMLRK